MLIARGSRKLGRAPAGTWIAWYISGVRQKQHITLPGGFLIKKTVFLDLDTQLAF